MLIWEPNVEWATHSKTHPKKAIKNITKNNNFFNLFSKICSYSCYDLIFFIHLKIKIINESYNSNVVEFELVVIIDFEILFHYLDQVIDISLLLISKFQISTHKCYQKYRLYSLFFLVDPNEK